MKRVFIYLLISCGLLFSFSDRLTAQDNTMSRLKKFFASIAAYNNQFTQEKVYLHLDNNGYFPGETIWYKAYVFRASTLLPTTLSKVLYVELVSPEGEVCMRKSFPIKNGRTYGEFKLENLLHTGFYEIRAYTRAMLNWDPSYAYSRVIPIYNTPKDSLNLTHLSLFEESPSQSTPHVRPATVPLRSNQTLKGGSYLLTFYPEGGHLTQGLPGRVAYKLTDTDGNPTTADLALCQANGQTVTSIATVHDGMGVFEVPAEMTGGYVKVGNSKFPLPEPQATGCDLRATCDNAKGLTLQVHPNSSFTSRTIGVSVTCRGTACYFDTIHAQPSGSYIKTVQRKQLRDGILQVTLFTDEGQVLAERLVWCEPQQAPMNLRIAQNEKVYQPFQPVVLDFTLQDATGTPRQGEFSLSVHDTGGDIAPDGMSLRTDMLLCSDLKGYIHQPEYYFQSFDEAHQKALDLLLMVQGWRRYEWKEMAGVTPFQLKQPAEDGMLIDGRIVDNSSKHKGKAGMDVNLMVMLNGTFVEGTSRTDSLGRFALQTPDFYGDGVGYFTTTVNDKRQTANVALNRQFSPTPAAYEPAMLQTEKPEQVRQQITITEPTTFVWRDTIPKIIFLPEAHVQDKGLHELYAARFTYLGGEAGAKPYASIYYNVEQEMDKILDRGETVPSIWDWLKQRNKDFDYSHTTSNTLDSFERRLIIYDDIPKEMTSLYLLSYKNRPVFLFRDNELQYQTRKQDNLDLLGDEIRSIIISEDPSTCSRFAPTAYQAALDYMLRRRSNGLGGDNREPVCIFLFSEVNSNLMQYRKGQRTTLLHGYSKPEEFFSPDYRRANRATPSDLRRTLYWNPMVDTDTNGKAHVIFYSNARPSQQLHINAQGISITGQLFGSK